jgi:hypothetical protein
MDPINSAILYAASRNRNFRNTTSGASWEVVGDSLAGGFRSLVVDPSNPSTLYVATETEVFKSLARGTRLRTTPKIVINGIAVDLRDDSTLFTYTWTGFVPYLHAETPRSGCENAQVISSGR